jgi:hypothetical protein
MTEPEAEPSKKELEFDIPPWNAVSITRQRAEDSLAERDAALEDLRASMSDKQILAKFGIDTRQFEG